MIFVLRQLQNYEINLNLKSSNYILCLPRQHNLNIARTAYFTNIFLVFTLFLFGHYFMSFVFDKYILSATVYVNIRYLKTGAPINLTRIFTYIRLL